MQLEPREYFTIVRQIENHLDAGTYYVRAKIRNARTDVLLDTVTLTDQGSLRFSTPWQVPADVSGQGFYIAILTEVFTDSGFTSKSPDYGDKMDVYLVQTRAKHGGGGGGTEVDYKKIEKMIDEKLSTSIKTLSALIDSVQKSIKGIKIPQTDLEQVTKPLEKLAESIAAIKIPVTDLSSVLSGIDGAHKSILELPQRVDSETYLSKLGDIAGKLDSTHTGLAGIVEKTGESLAEIAAEKIEEKLASVPEKVAEIVREATQQTVDKNGGLRFILAPEEGKKRVESDTNRAQRLRYDE